MAEVVGVVVPGPGFGGPAVRQSGKAPGWWTRHEGRLHVLCYGSSRWWPAPVPMADLTAPIPDSRPDPRRITMALDLRSLDGPEVDEALGVADAFDTVVDSWEAGEVVPSVEEVRRLAFLTGFAPGWFYGGPLPELGTVFVCGRRSR